MKIIRRIFMPTPKNSSNYEGDSLLKLLARCPSGLIVDDLTLLPFSILPGASHTNFDDPNLEKLLPFSQDNN